MKKEWVWEVSIEVSVRSDLTIVVTTLQEDESGLLNIIQQYKILQIFVRMLIDL